MDKLNIQLERPVVFFDLETTGVSVTNDRIVEIAMTKINVDGTELQSFYTLVNPQMPIPQSSTDIHGISDADVEDQDRFAAIAPSILEFIEGCDLGGYNIENFDVPMLLQEFHRTGINWNYKASTIIDVFKIYTVMEPRTLSGVYKRFTGKSLEDAHSAKADNDATIEIFKAQLEKYSDNIGNAEDIKSIKYKDEQPKLDLAGKFIRADKDVLFNFGKYKGKSVTEVFADDANYFMWMVDKADFPSETKAYARKIHAKLSQTTLHK